MAYPSTFSTFNRPGSSDRLNNPSHSALHNTVSSALGQVEAVIGLSGNSSTLGTIIGDLRSPDSNGGGHVQTANKGGTGQTSYTKGDLLVATSSSVLAKLAVTSTTGEVLTADTTTASGVKWAAPAGATKIAINTGSISTGAGAASVAVVLYSASITGSLLGSSNGIKFNGVVQNFKSENNFTIAMRYGNNTVASTTAVIPGGASLMSGFISGTLVSFSHPTSQLGYINFNIGNNRIASPNNGGGNSFQQGTSSVESSANQDLVITGKYEGYNTNNSILTGLFTVEKIV